LEDLIAGLHNMRIKSGLLASELEDHWPLQPEVACLFNLITDFLNWRILASTTGLLAFATRRLLASAIGGLV
jgi:hypothetical protein